MKSDDIPDIHDTDARDFEEWLGQAEWDEDCRREEKWESGDTITIGEAKCLADWAIEMGVNYQTLCSRLNKYPVEIAFNM